MTSTPTPTTTTSSSLPPTRITVLISGSGTNLAALISACQPSAPPPSRSASSPPTSTTPHLPSCTLIRVISNRRSAYGLTRASDAAIPTHYHNLVAYKKQLPSTPAGVLAARESYDADLAALILADEPDLVVCAGWMHILTAKFLDPLREADVDVINLHPALPGAFDGANAIARAWEAGRSGEITRTGVMIHYVVDEVDRGEPVVVKEIELREGESLEELEGRVHEVEWKAIVEGTNVAVRRLWDRRKITKGAKEGSGS
ncbi:MAG: hypothetical protein M1817_001839 [Caeruleum heppii]|nr:MAG: hypothetical protein M1817_001839 [Caeruleum heppii]